VDAPSDRQDGSFFHGFRDTPESAADARAIIAWLRSRSNTPVWIVGTSRGTESAAYLGTALQGAEAPAGIVLTSSVLSDKRGGNVIALPLERIAVPVLVVHHENDECLACLFSGVPGLMRALSAAPRKELIAMRGGRTQGHPCEAFGYHGYNGLEAEVVQRIAAWIGAP
jgi:pimeloyl-ACP methyl ester carboxylesterase